MPLDHLTGLAVQHADDAHVIAARVRDAIVATDLHIGASLGIALDHAGDTSDRILRRADQAQYRAKGMRSSAIAIAGATAPADLLPVLAVE